MQFHRFFSQFITFPNKSWVRNTICRCRVEGALYLTKLWKYGLLLRSNVGLREQK